MMSEKDYHEAMMAEQENKDFITTKRIMEKIFSAYGYSTTLTQMPKFAHYDAKMEVAKGDTKKKYTIEIKERNVYDEEVQYLPLKCKKWAYITANTKNDEVPLVIYLLSDNTYYIYNLQKIDMNKVKLMNWEIPKQNYVYNKQIEVAPTFFIPTSEAQYNGIITK